MQQRSEETRTRILNVAEELFAQKGYDATGVAELCAGAKVSKGAFYHHFPSKQAVFQALLSSWLAQLDQQLEINLSSTPTIPAGLMAMAGQTEKIFEGASSRTSIFLEFWMQAIRQPEIWKSAVAPYYRYMDVFSGVFQKGIAEGSLDPEIDPRSSARLVLALAMGLLLQAFFDPAGANWERVTEHGVRTLINGLAKRSGQDE